MSPALYSISIKSKKNQRIRRKEKCACVPTYLPILRRNILFLSVFSVHQFLDVREREREEEDS